MVVSRPTPNPKPLLGARIDEVSWHGTDPTDVLVSGVTHDSRAVQPGDIYAALPGANVHGAMFITDAIANGAVAVLTDRAGWQSATDVDVPVAVVEQPRSVVGELARWVYDDPGSRLLLIGITGTNGKTTVSYLVEGGLSAAGHRTGIVGTTGIWIDDQLLPSARTTPEAADVHALLAVMVERGVTAVVMEVSSHALVLGRVDGLTFDVALFTNLSQDHLDYHGTMADYFAAKASLFTPQRARKAVICVDDDWGVALAQQCPLPVQTYGLGLRSHGLGTTGIHRDFTAWRVEPTATGHLAISVAAPDGATIRLESPLPGRFNAANALGAFVTLLAAGISTEPARNGLLLARSVPGRMERIGATIAGFPLFVDYAHTPDAVQRVLTAAREITNGEVIVVLGCGGDRDQGKRPRMGELAAVGADRAFFTDDNPRSEDPATIRAQMLAGVPERFIGRVTEVPDRAEAISRAVLAAKPGDVVLILGKGHELGQEVGGVVTPFDDRVESLQALRQPGVARLERS